MTALDVFDQPRTKPAYLHAQLPLVMASDRGLARFLRGLDEMASELYERVGQKEFLFEVGLAPLPVVRLMAGQIGVPIDPMLPAPDQRQIARVASATFPIRGTRESLRRNLEALTGSTVRIDDPTGITADGTPRIAEPTSVRREGRDVSTTAAPPPADPGSDRAASDLAAQQHVRLVTIGVDGLGRATSASVRAAVQREVDCSAGVVFDPPLPEPEEGGA